MDPSQEPRDNPFLAVIGMACRYPGAADVEEFWANIMSGKESITQFPKVSEGNPASRVAAAGVLEHADEFDAAFFGYSPMEALLLDPQQRVFLECGWTALEHAGYDPQTYPGAIGVYAGCSMTSHGQHLREHLGILPGVDEWAIKEATTIDYVPSRLSYKLGLTGPAMGVQASCATSLAAIHVAGQALLAGECDIALAGGVTVHVPPNLGPSSEEAPLAPDGHCRAFDAAAQGTVGSEGAGVVVLKRLEDALADADHIQAVVRGSAANNDGNRKVGFTAPSVGGQAAAVRAAHLVAEVDPATITYVEAHGTGTVLGDPIEVAALTSAFRIGTDRCQYCRLGSVKTNIGHADAAAGAAGFIKTVLALRRALIPPSLHFSHPNPEIDFENSPFQVNSKPWHWITGGQPRRAGVNALGIGGTNVHIVLEEPPSAVQPDPPQPWELLPLSAKTATALEQTASRLADHLRGTARIPLADVAWTLQAGRAAHGYRSFAVCRDQQDAAAVLSAPSDRRITARAAPRECEVAFVFPGHGGQHPGMGQELYLAVPSYREAVDDCCALAAQILGGDLRAALYPELFSGAAKGFDVDPLADVAISQVAIFTTEYALARMWQHWGVRPSAVAGHSLGAYAAACTAGVFTLDGALRLVTERGIRLRAVVGGAMLAVPLPEKQVLPLLGEETELAAVNGPEQCIVSGPATAIDELEFELDRSGIDSRRLRIPGAGHSAATRLVATEMARAFAEVTRRPPSTPMVSDQTGSWLTPAQATDPDYWAMHMVRTVRFADALGTLLASPDRVILEAGPGQALTGLTRQRPDLGDGIAVPSLPRSAVGGSALASVLTAAGMLWLAGLPIDWARLHEGRRPRRTPLPTYPFERQRFTFDSHEENSPSQPSPSASPGGGNRGRAISFPRPEHAGDYVAPRSPLERELCRTFGEVLGFAEIGIHDNFFSFGGDSLIASRVITRIRREFQVRIPPRRFYDDPTVADVAEIINEARKRGAADV